MKYKCNDCKDTSKITLLYSRVDCDCVNKHIHEFPKLSSDLWFSWPKVDEHRMCMKKCCNNCTYEEYKK